MSGPLSYSGVLLLIQGILLIALIARMFLSGLQGSYPFFTTYLIVQTVQLAIVGLGVGTDAYVHAYVATESVVLCLYALIILEQYSNVFRSVPGIERLARKFVQSAIALAVAISLLLMHFEQTPGPFMGKFYVFERAILSSLVVFVLFMSVFLVYYPIALNRNTVVYTAGFALYFLSKATIYFTGNTGILQNKWLRQNIALAIPIVCLAIWLVFLNRRGEQNKVIFGHSWDRSEEEMMVAQLRSINDYLLRTARR